MSESNVVAAQTQAEAAIATLSRAYVEVAHRLQACPLGEEDRVSSAGLEAALTQAREAIGRFSALATGDSVRLAAGMLAESFYVEGSFYQERASQPDLKSRSPNRGSRTDREAAIRLYQSALEALVDDKRNPALAAKVHFDIGLMASGLDGGRQGMQRSIASFRRVTQLQPSGELANGAREQIGNMQDLLQSIVGTATADGETIDVSWFPSSGKVRVFQNGQWQLRGRAASCEDALRVAEGRSEPPVPQPAHPIAGSSCVIATACSDDGGARLSLLRSLRDDAILSDPIACDFFHVFWSRYYEWSPGVARIAEQDPRVAGHIRWAFLDPWFSWLEAAARFGTRRLASLEAHERNEILERLDEAIATWRADLPVQMESKRPPDEAALFDAYERFTTAACIAFRKRRSGS